MTHPDRTAAPGESAETAGSPTRSDRGSDATGPGSADSERGRAMLPAEVRSAAAALERAGLDYLFLRGWEVPDADEIDMLVRPETFARVSEVLRPLGYAELLGPGRGSHRFLVRYDVPQNRWTKLDIVSEIAFGARQELPGCEAEDVLRRADSDHDVRVLAPGDRLWATLLHRVADASERRGGAELHELDLQRLGAAADTWSPLAEPFLSAARKRGVRGSADVSLAIDAARWQDADVLERLTRSAVGSIQRRRRVEIGVRVIRHDLRHLARRIQSSIALPARRGLVVVLLGSDGAGKSELAASLTRSTPLPVRSRYMGLYQAGRKRRRRGVTGVARLAAVVSTSVSAWLDRRRGRIVVLDRHVYDLLERPGSRRSRLRRALYTRAGITPDIVIVLDAPAAVLHQRRPEQSVSAAADERERYLRIAAALPQATVVDAEKPASEVLSRVHAIIWDGLTSRRPRRSSADHACR